MKQTFKRKRKIFNFPSVANFLIAQPLLTWALSIFIVDREMGHENSFIESKAYMQLKALHKFLPSPYIFSLVWIFLLISVGYSAFIVFKKEPHTLMRAEGLLLNQLQLLISFIWSITYFYYGSALYALIAILFLNISILALIYFYYKVDKTAAFLLIPYALWIFFTTYLNYLTL